MNRLMLAAFALLGLLGRGMQTTPDCAWNSDFPGMMCAAGSSFAQFLGVTGAASLVGAVLARRLGADEEALTFVGALLGAVFVFAMLSSGF
jgi:hypothetical protein